MTILKAVGDAETYLNYAAVEALGRAKAPGVTDYLAARREAASKVEWPLALAHGLLCGVFVFAAAHYIRGVKRYWTFFGHLALGTLFCVAFYYTRALWLPLGLHAAGILVLSAARPFIRYTGPAWLVGASIFPYAGAVGIVALLALALNVALSYGGLP